MWIEFSSPTTEQKAKLLDHYLEIDSIDEYREVFGYEDEMFTGYGIDWKSSYFGGYLPTRDKLDLCNGSDWY